MRATAKENVARFLEELDGNEKAKALLEANAANLDAEEGLKVLAAVARETGYDVTDDEVMGLFESRKATLVNTSKAAADEFLTLSDDELDSVAGGKGFNSCSESFQPDENCMFSDNCKKVITNYYFDENNAYCESYGFCKGIAIKPDCKLGRIGV